MHINIEDFKTGWFGLGIGLTDAEVSILIERLLELQRSRGHFHFRSDFSGTGGIGDVEIYHLEPNAPRSFSIH